VKCFALKNCSVIRFVSAAVGKTLVAKRKPGNQQGRPVEPKWVFDPVDLGTDDFFMEMVDQHEAVTLESIIHNHIS